MQEGYKNINPFDEWNDNGSTCINEVVHHFFCAKAKRASIDNNNVVPWKVAHHENSPVKSQAKKAKTLGKALFFQRETQ